MQQFLQPKNALQRANELISVGQSEEAFETLHRTITDRKFRYVQWDPAQQEEVVKLYNQLAVVLDRVKSAREGLLQFRNHCQHTVSNASPLIRVLNFLRSEVEEKYSRAETAWMQEQAESGKPQTEIPEFEIGEPMYYTALSSEGWTPVRQAFDRCQRQVMEVYKTILDIVKSTPGLQTVYHQTAHRAFNFCRKHNKQTEFRRLCETIRTHYTSLMRQKLKREADANARVEFDELRRPELHIETRLSQLNNAAALGLWKEAMQTTEDLYSLGIIELTSKRIAVKTKSSGALQLRNLLLVSLSAYYEKLAEIFELSGFSNLHAVGLLKWLSHTKTHNKGFSPQENQIWASMATLAVLSVPVVRGQDLRSHARFEEEKRLAALLGYPTVPTREALVAALRDLNILADAAPCVREIFEIIESEDLQPLTAVATIQPLIGQIREFFANPPSLSDVQMTPMTERTQFTERTAAYIDKLKTAFFRKLVIKLAGVYRTIRIDYFRERVCPEDFMPWVTAERQLVLLVDECRLQLRLDYVNGAIRLVEQEAHGAVAERFGSLAAALLRVIACTPTQQHKIVLAGERDVRSRVNADIAVAQVRLQFMEKKRQDLELDQRRRDEDLEELAKEKARREAVAEQEKQKQLAEEKAKAREKEDIEAARLECAKQLLKKMSALVTAVGAQPSNFQLGDVALGTLTPPTLLARRVTLGDFEQSVENYRQKVRQEQIKAKRAEYKKADHLARAWRVEEAMAAAKWAEDVEKKDAEMQEMARNEAAKQKEQLMENLEATQAMLEGVKGALLRWVVEKRGEGTTRSSKETDEEEAEE